MGLNMQSRLKEESLWLFPIKFKVGRKVTFQRILFLLYNGGGKQNQFLKQTGCC